MARSPNAQIAVDQYTQLLAKYKWDKSEAWHGIVRLLLTCKHFEAGGWKPLRDVVVYREANDFKKGDNAVLERAEKLSQYLAQQLGIPRSSLCDAIGTYWNTPRIATTQPNNIVGHAFRSIAVTILKTFGDPRVTYEEEVAPATEFPGYPFPTRSKQAKFDIVARRGSMTVALISSRWRFRHDRVDVVDEAVSYAPAARHHNPNCRLYVLVGEFDPSRLYKIISNCPPIHAHPAISAAVHFAPELISQGLGVNGDKNRVQHLKSLEWLIGESFTWK
jgi:hypothetical protein